VRLVQRAVLSLLALTLIGLPSTLPGSASAATGARSAAAVPCLADTVASFQGLAAAGQQVPKWRQHADTTPVTAKDLAALPAQETRPLVVNRKVRPKLASEVDIPTYVHVIKGKHKRERNPAGPKKVRALLRTLNLGMAGRQSKFAVGLRYRFRLKKINYRKNDRWYHASLFDRADRQEKRRLHRGNKRTLNLYITGGGRKGDPILGWSRFPWQYASSPKLDSVTVSVAAMRGGAATGYNLGDTVIHETGHWLGLYHTFQGGCGSQGDLVPDTPAEAEPSFDCDTTRDTCVDDPGLDPVHNFMDYSLDSCMNRFTAGQARRVDAAFAKWR
jgi:hypothetical protein